MSAAAVINVGFVVVFALLAVAIWRVSRRVPKQPETAAAPARPAPLVAVLDTEPGINLALHDECELLYTMPTHPGPGPGPDLASGLDRLRAAIHDEQKGDQA